MKKARSSGLLLAVVLAVTTVLHAGDWPQWRGQTRDGIAPDSPALVDAFGQGGPVKLWTSEPVQGDKKGGYGSVAVAKDRVYVLSHRSFRQPSEQRRINRQRLSEQGYAQNIPAEFSALVEAARVSEPRLKITDKMKAIEWGEVWLKENMKPEWRPYYQAALDRITGGPYAPPLDVLAKLETVKGRVFAGQQELDAWYKENGISEDVGKLLAARLVIDVTLPMGEDTLFCFDADNGQTAWKKKLPGSCLDWPASSTPTVTDGRVYLFGSGGVVFCLGADDGRLLWKSDALDTPDNGRSRCSSVLVVDGLAVVCTKKNLVALDVQTGKTAWTQKKVRSESASAVAWKSGDRSCVICSGANKVNCLDLKTGEILWTVPSASDSTPVIVGQYMVFVGGSDEVGLTVTVFKLSPDKPERVWNVPLKDIYTSPVIREGYVYAVGDKCAKCVELATGKVAWEQKIEPGVAELSSPVLADGKLIIVAGPWLYLVKASPEKFTLLDKADLGLTKWTSPAIVAGKLFVRTNEAVVCYDLRKQ